MGQFYRAVSQEKIMCNELLIVDHTHKPRLLLAVSNEASRPASPSLLDRLRQPKFRQERDVLEDTSRSASEPTSTYPRTYKLTCTRTNVKKDEVASVVTPAHQSVLDGHEQDDHDDQVVGEPQRQTHRHEVDDANKVHVVVDEADVRIDLRHTSSRKLVERCAEDNSCALAVQSTQLAVLVLHRVVLHVTTDSSADHFKHERGRVVLRTDLHRARDRGKVLEHLH
ncbi:hypothetical protein GQ600_26873 [Phytophthora cactorum]|nr:hypothetical protein GQ600_26873 [Phytophthora cactorum]